MVVFDGSDKGQQEYDNEHVLENKRWIRNYASKSQILLLVFLPLTTDDNGFRRKGFATEEGTHISAAAYIKLAAYTQEVFVLESDEP